MSDYRDKLTELELDIFNKGCAQFRSTIQWKRRELEKVSTCTVGGNTPKKRRASSDF